MSDIFSKINVFMRIAEQKKNSRSAKPSSVWMAGLHASEYISWLIPLSADSFAVHPMEYRAYARRMDQTLLLMQKIIDRTNRYAAKYGLDPVFADRSGAFALELGDAVYTDGTARYLEYTGLGLPRIDGPSVLPALTELNLRTGADAVSGFLTAVRDCEVRMAGVCIHASIASQSRNDGEAFLAFEQAVSQAEESVKRLSLAVANVNRAVNDSGMPDFYPGDTGDRAQLLSFVGRLRREAMPEGRKRYEAMRTSSAVSIVVPEEQAQRSEKSSSIDVSFLDPGSENRFSIVQVKPDQVSEIDTDGKGRTFLKVFLEADAMYPVKTPVMKGNRILGYTEAMYSGRAVVDLQEAAIEMQKREQVLL